MKIAQSRQGFGHPLNLVQKQKSALPVNRPTGNNAQLLQNARNVERRENLRQIQMALKIDFMQRETRCGGELPHQRGLADLTRPAQDQWLAIR